MKDYVLTLLMAAAITYLLTPLVRRGAIRVGALKQPRERDIHTAPVPTLGGVAMYVGLAAGLFVADQIPQLREFAFTGTGMVPGLLLAGGLLVVMGIVDDRWGLSALTKLAGQVAAGAILVATGTQLDWLPLPGGSTFATTPDQSTLLTILIVVATINAVNFIDGLDGLAAGIVAIAAVSFLIYYYSMTKVVEMSALAAPALASAILTGICLGFLPHNFHPARIFMGDTGAMLLGLVLAYAPISSIASLDPAAVILSSRVNRYPEIMPLLLPAALLVIPYADLLLAVVRRARMGQSPFAADQKHLHHRLLQIGHSQRASVLVMYLWALLFSGTIVWFSLEKTARPKVANHHGHPVVVFVVITAAAVLALLLMAMPRWRNRDKIARPELSDRAAARPALSTPRPDELVSVTSPPLPAPVAAQAPAMPADWPAALIDGDGAGPTGPLSRGESADRPKSEHSRHPRQASLIAPTQPVRSVIGTVPPAVTGGQQAADAAHDGDELNSADQMVWQDRPEPGPGGRAAPGGLHERPEPQPRRLPHVHALGSGQHDPRAASPRQDVRGRHAGTLPAAPGYIDAVGGKPKPADES